MQSAVNGEAREWLPLGAARRVLEVNESTLRNWADSGALRTYRTPGGHRRFYREDVLSLAQNGQRRDSPEMWEDRALRRIRRRLQWNRNSTPDWYHGIDESSRTRLRLFGRQLLALAREYMGHRARRKRLLEEVDLLGYEYGDEMARLKLSLADAVQAFLFFRNSLLNESDRGQGSAPAIGSTSQAWQLVNQIADRVLMAIIHAYQKAPALNSAAKPDR